MADLFPPAGPIVLPFPLGREESIDPRDSNFLMKAHLPLALPLQKARHWTGGDVLNQSDTYHKEMRARNSCVGQGWKGWQMCTPVPTKDGPGAIEIYKWACGNDEWSDNDDRDDGTSVRAGVQYLVNAGRVKSYIWMDSVEIGINWLIRHGPVVMGTPWYEAMFYPDNGAFVHLGGRLAGGHCWLWTGVNLHTGNIKGRNSWGGTWGKGGDFFMTIAEFKQLFEGPGYSEGCAAVERKLRPQPV